MKCVLCEKTIAPYEPGTLLLDDPYEPSNSGAWHENCYKEYREDYKTADEIIQEMKDGEEGN